MYFNRFLCPALASALLAGLLAACGGGGGSAPNAADSGNPGGVRNVLGVKVDAGPAGSGRNVNVLYATVKICRPGTSQCQTIDHVTVDTGSSGLRILASALAPGLNLSRLTGTSGLPLLNCAQFVDNSAAWGPVASADVVLAGMTAANVPIQIIGDAQFNSLTTAQPSPCGGAVMLTAQDLGGNGVLGIGLSREDCGTDCAVSRNNGSYYTCTDARCTAVVGTSAGLDRQLKNPVALFSSDNNGVLIDLPSVGTAGATSLSGSLIFGIGTQSNNQLGSGVVLTTDSLGDITTVFAGRSLTTSFIDSGSNGLFFASSTIPSCPSSTGTGFYCPSGLTALSATLVGANAAQVAVAFSIDNASVMFADSAKTVLPGLSGPLGDTLTFDWGLPFFFGRRVFIGIEGQASSIGTGPFYAF